LDFTADARSATTPGAHCRQRAPHCGFKIAGGRQDRPTILTITKTRGFVGYTHHGWPLWRVGRVSIKPTNDYFPHGLRARLRWHCRCGTQVMNKAAQTLIQPNRCNPLYAIATHYGLFRFPFQPTRHHRPAGGPRVRLTILICLSIRLPKRRLPGAWRSAMGRLHKQAAEWGPQKSA